MTQTQTPVAPAVPSVANTRDYLAILNEVENRAGSGGRTYAEALNNVRGDIATHRWAPTAPHRPITELTDQLRAAAIHDTWLPTVPDGYHPAALLPALIPDAIRAVDGPLIDAVAEATGDYPPGLSPTPAAVRAHLRRWAVRVQRVGQAPDGLTADEVARG